MGTRAQHSPAYRRLCQLLRKQRASAGLSMRELAAQLGKAHSYVAKVEHGTRRIDPIEFVYWCQACGADPAEAILHVAK